MNILDTIVAKKKEEVEVKKLETSIDELIRSPLFERETYSLRSFLKDENRTGIIAEFKRKSPSKGIINDRADVIDVTWAYANYGASCISVLTDEPFFGGHANDLAKARINALPLLRKEFIVDEYQVIESKALGADVILLIAACLTPAEVRQFAAKATQLKMDVLLEIHNEDELGHICDETEFIGVNNRDLKTFTVDLDRSIELASKIPSGKLKIAESGIRDEQTIITLKQHGFDGFLIGERFMRESDPGEAFRLFVKGLKSDREF